MSVANPVSLPLFPRSAAGTQRRSVSPQPVRLPAPKPAPSLVARFLDGLQQGWVDWATGGQDISKLMH